MKKYKKYIISFLVAFCVSFGCAFTAFGATKVYDFTFSQPSYGDDFGYIEVDFGSYCYLILFFVEGNDDMSNIELVANYNTSLNRLTIQPHPNSSDDEYFPTQIWAYYTRNDGDGAIGNFINNGNTLQQDYPYKDFTSTPIGFHYYGIGRAGANLSSDFTCVYGSDYLAYNQLNKILSAINSLNGTDNSKVPSQSDKDTINNTESKQDELMESTNPTDKTESLQTDLMSFANSAPDTLNVAKSMFDRLVTGKIGIIVFGSVCLAIFPLLINVIKGRVD